MSHLFIVLRLVWKSDEIEACSDRRMAGFILRCCGSIPDTVDGAFSTKQTSLPWRKWQFPPIDKTLRMDLPPGAFSG
jgi:hypothetical protein